MSGHTPWREIRRPRKSETFRLDLRRRLFDRDYSPAFQDEYARLWHEAASERDKLARQLRRLGWKRHMVEDES